MRKTLLVALALLLIAGGLTAPRGAAADLLDAPLPLYLRRATFDPLQKAPPTASLSSADPSSLMIVQLDAPPDDAARAALEAAGMRPLWYIPENALLVRVADAASPQIAAALPGVRWSGPFDAAYKLAEDLDPLLASADSSPVDLRLTAAPDADLIALTESLAALGAAVVAADDGLNGATLHVVAPAAALAGMVARDDVLWVERHHAPQIFDDRSRAILGVPAVRAPLGLTGAGQIIAVTDTGLDVQARLSPDFAGRIAAGFTPRQLSGLSSCPDDWSDPVGHGTHVAGIALGSGARSNGQLAGIAPEARLVVQAAARSAAITDSLACLATPPRFLAQAYGAGARIQNGSFGIERGCFGCYQSYDGSVDDFLWRNKDHLFVVAAGNTGRDAAPADGVVDADSITSPGTAKNVLTVGASENDRPPTGACSSATPERVCWNSFGFSSPPLRSDPVSDNPGGIAAFSARGPTDDGRIKPEIVAPGTNIVSTRTRLNETGFYRYPFNADYAFLSGTSMSAPAVSGVAALTRQWLAQHRFAPAPSAALVKALILNGGVSLSPGQYPGLVEVPAEWPNSVQGWGRASVPTVVGAGAEDQVWLRDGPALRTGEVAEYALRVAAGQPLRVTLAWTDFPAAPAASRALVNDLDLEVVGPNGVVVYGNGGAALREDCRSAGADRCNNVESVEIVAPADGVYTVRARAFAVPSGPQPFALAARGRRVLDAALASPAIQAAGSVALSWAPVPGALFYRVQLSAADAPAAPIIAVTSGTTYVALDQPGVYVARVQACTSWGCGEFGAPQRLTITVAPRVVALPAVGR